LRSDSSELLSSLDEADAELQAAAKTWQAIEARLEKGESLTNADWHEVMSSAASELEVSNKELRRLRKELARFAADAPKEG
jgi:hypothetical protein